MPIAPLTKPNLIFTGLDALDRNRTLRYFADRIAIAEDLDAEELFHGLLEREELGSTGIGGGVAIPHCRTDRLREGLLAIGVANEGIDFGAADGQPVKLLFVVVSPKADPLQNLRFLSAISAWVKEKGNIESLLEMPTPPAIYELLQGVPSSR